MNHDVTTLERAFQLARSGSYDSVPNIKRRLKSEGYSIGQVNGPALYKQLRALMENARGQGNLSRGSPSATAR